MYSTIPEKYILPDILSLIPFSAAINPHHKEAAAASATWIHKYNLMNDRRRSVFLHSSSALLSAHVYPYASCERLRMCGEFLYLLFSVDEISDVQNGKDAYSTGRDFLETLQDPDSGSGSELSRMTIEFRQRMTEVDAPTSFQRFLKSCEEYVNAFAIEAHLRERGEVPSLQDYISLRRGNSAVGACLDLFGFVLDIDLPDKIVEHPVLKRMYNAAIDMVCLANDLYSYKIEYANGLTGNNIMTILMHENGYDLQTAANSIGVIFGQVLGGFMFDKLSLPNWGPKINAEVEKYVVAMQNWVSGSCNWSFSMQRYFGSDYEEVRRTRVVHLVPK